MFELKTEMIMKKFLKPMLFLVAMATLTTSCKNDDNTAPVTPEPSGDQNIVELATATPDLSSLVAALQRADLVSALEADGNFTVLAPTNAAFDTFLAENDFASLEDIPVDALRQVLLNHVISGISSAYSAADLISEDAGYVENLADGPDAGTNVSTYFNTSNGVQFNGVSSVTTADVGATNGIVHIVDTVIPLPTVVTFIVADPNFSTLEDALINLTPAADFPSLLNRMVGETSAPFTVFAPLNAAFEKLDAIPPEDVLGPIFNIISYTCRR